MNTADIRYKWIDTALEAGAPVAEELGEVGGAYGAVAVEIGGA